MPRKLTNQEFIDKCKAYPEYSPLEAYIDTATPILFRHERCGREFRLSPAKLFSGRGCPHCRVEARNKMFSRRGEAKFREMLDILGLKIVEDFEYTNNKAKVLVECVRCGHRQKSMVSNISVGHGCKHCGGLKNNPPQPIEPKLAEKAPEWELVGEYKNIHTLTLFRHKPCGKTFYRHPGALLAKPDTCKRCHPSKPEKEILEWVETLVPDALSNDRTVLEGKELDIYIPSKKVAIEYNGHYWHSLQVLAKNEKMSYAEAKKYHYMKSFNCEQKGVRLIHIWDYEWADEKKQKVLKNIILGALGMLPERYYARNTICKHYEQGCARWKELGDFFENNNIQGNRGGSHVFTLEDKDGRILMAYKFGRPSGGRAKKLYEYEMVRGASAPGVQVVGGASKLWKHFVDTLHPNSAVYYIDYNYFDGRSVEKLGGKFIISQPGVKNYWVDTEVVKNREPARHVEVKKAIADGKVLEMWNAGTKTYAFTWQ